MPTYQYRCTDCGEDLEAVQSFSDDALTECPTCGGALRKVFSPVGVVFKGSGFYRNDSRAKTGSTGASGQPAAAAGGDAAPAKESAAAPAAAGSAAAGSANKEPVGKEAQRRSGTESNGPAASPKPAPAAAGSRTPSAGSSAA